MGMWQAASTCDRTWTRSNANGSKAGFVVRQASK